MSLSFFFLVQLLLVLLYTAEVYNFNNITSSSSKEFRNAIILNFTYLTELPIMKVNLGTPPQSLNLILNTAIFYTTITHYKCNICTNTSSLYNPQYSNTYKMEEDKTFNYLNTFMDGFIFFEKIFLHNLYDRIDYFGLSLITKYYNRSELNFSGYLGLNKNYINNGGNTFSLMDMLFQDKFIIQKRFRFNFASNYSNNRLILGNVFNEYDNQTSFYSSCNANHKTNLKSQYLKNSDLYDYWFCNLSSIHFNIIKDMVNNSIIDEKNYLNNSINVNKFAIFSTAERKILAPFHFMSIFIEKLSKYVSSVNFTCKIIQKNLNTTHNHSMLFLDCPNSNSNISSLISNLEFDISFVFNGFAYVVENKNLYKKINVENNSSDREIYEIVIEFDDELEFFILGMSFLSNFDVLFLKDKNEIGFFNGKRLNFTNFTLDIVEVESDSKGSSFKFYIGNILIILVIIFFIIWYIRRNKRKKELNQSYQSMMENY
jgi:hypothetical protein